MIVKICGLTSLDDARAAAELGADYLGFNFYPKSPRSIAELDCERIVAALRKEFPHPVCVGVFVNHPPADIIRIVRRCGLDTAQLSGDEPPEALAALAEAKIPAFKAVRAPIGEGCLARMADAATAEPALLLDANVAGRYGGTGRTADWDWARSIAARRPVFLAGGLTPENVADAIRNVRPWGVDTASGVERSAGKKDRRLMAAFVAAAMQAHQEISIRIDPAQCGDAAEILALQKLAYRSEAELNNDFSIPPLTQTLAEMESEFSSKRFLKAATGGRIIGSVRGERRDGTCCIGRLIVHPNWQNRGVGGRLLRAIETDFPEAGRFELFTSDRSERNLYLYGKMGYREFKREPLNERVTLVYLEKVKQSI
ncbi:MAG: GNAT family N-acetyltransferase [Anaerolineales bacterium]|nr:GNAT family N-acetyltransferase [Anaerolineales bacterium]